MYKVGDCVLLGEVNLPNGTSKKRWVVIEKVLMPIKVQGLRGLMKSVNQYLSNDHERFSEYRIIDKKTPLFVTVREEITNG